MKKYKIALVGGDGVGPEVVEAAKKVLEATAKKAGNFKLLFHQYPAGYSAFEDTGKALPDETLEGMKSSDAIIIGALATGKTPPPSPMGVLRRTFDLYADVRPIRSFRGGKNLRNDIDILIIRENTEGFLADRNLYKGYGEFMPDPDTVISLRVVTRRNSERIARFCFESARKLKRKRVTIAHKANALRFGCGFFVNVCKEVAENYPDIVTTDEYIDSVANNLITRPQDYDMILTTNLYGDIISDEAAALVGNLVPTANFGEKHGLFRPIHEAIESQAGKNIVNPIPTILSGAMMLEWFGEVRAAKAIENTIEQLLVNKSILPRDSGGKASTLEVVEAISKLIQENKQWE